MKKQQKLWCLLAAWAGIIAVPYAGILLKNNGMPPPQFFAFPPLAVDDKSPFSLPAFIILSVIVLFFVGGYIFPYMKVYGFKKVVAPPRDNPFRLPPPLWFWFGLVMFFGTLLVLLMHWSEPRWLIEWAVIPLFWGFTFILDGWVYVRNSGKSIISESPQKMVGIAFGSVAGWMLFEYLNFFPSNGSLGTRSR